MNETQRNIKRYKAALPGLRERITAAALLLAISLSMVVSASFAWYTISSAPEVSAINTTVAANGNLEIALVDKEGEKPAITAVGDSSATEGQTLVNSNITWGNLVNLSDASYGLSHMSLRPALLSGYNMTRAPLYGATYSTDGRVEKVSETYEYATWTNFGKDANGKDILAFAGGDKAKYGVRAIASVKYTNETGNAQATVMLGEIRNKLSAAQDMYKALILNKVDVGGAMSMDALKSLLELYVQDQAAEMLGSGTSPNYGKVVYYMYGLVAYFYDVVEVEGAALLDLVNLQAYMAGSDKGSQTYESISDMLTAYSNKTMFTKYGLKEENLSALKTYSDTRTKMVSALAGMEKYNSSTYYPQNNPPAVAWADFSTYVNYMVDISTAELDDMVISKLSGDDLGGLASILLGNSKNNMSKVVIKGGALKEVEQRLGAMLADNQTWMSIYLDVSGLPIIGTYRGNVYATVSTDAQKPFLLFSDLAATESLGFTGQGGDATAKDIYGMAIDLWLRTNMEGVNLILEGNVSTTDIQATCVARNSEVVPLYTILEDDGDILEVYMLTEEVEQEGSEETVEVDNWYNAATHTLVDTDANLKAQGIKPEEKMVALVTGYEGENRIWEDFKSQIDEGMIPEDFTTQGSGSCYVFYANPTDQPRILELLEAFSIAFLDQEGEHIATAKLDTEHAYAINGKVTVPMKLTDGVTYTDEYGADQIAIMRMEQNEAAWITAIVYLDGLRLTNEQVLAAGEIEGRMNLQFGSSVPLTSAKNDDLLYDSRTVSAVASYTGPDGTTQTSNTVNDPIELKYDGDKKKITVTLTVDGDQPNTISGFFVRTISSTQGTRLETVDFKKNGNVWTADFDLSKPGTYLLRNVIMDGVDYSLEKTVVENGVTTVYTEYPAVVIDGQSITSVWCEYGTGVIMTADSYVDVDVAVEIDAVDELMPKQVRAIFKRTDSSASNEEFTAVLTYAEGRWQGTARITSSGSFTLQYVAMDGDYRLLDEKFQRTLLLTLGLSAEVGCTNISSIPPEFTGERVTLNMQLKIRDSEGNELRALDGVKLYYHSVSSNSDTNGMNGNMTWNPDTGWYEGNMLLSSPGIFVFNRVDIPKEGETLPNSVYRATTSPRFSLMSADPPVFVQNVTDGYQFVPDNLGRLKESTDLATATSGAVMGVQLKNAEAAEIWALMRNSRGTESDKDDQVQLVKLKENSLYRLDRGENGTVYLFDVPRSDSGSFYQNKQDGQWTMEAVCLQNVYIKDEGKMYSITDTEPTLDNYQSVCHVIELEGNTSKVVETVNLTILKDGEKKNDYSGAVYGLDATGARTGAFMASYTESGLAFRITDWQGVDIAVRDSDDEINDGMNQVLWTVNYDSTTTNSHGGYTTTSVLDMGGNKTLTAVNDETQGARVYSIPSVTYQRAGKYTFTLFFSYGTSSETSTHNLISNDRITYRVYSKTPTVTIDSVEGSNSSNTSNATSATVYTKSGTQGMFTKYTIYDEAPRVNIQLVNSGYATSASLTFYSGSTETNRMYTSWGTSVDYGMQTEGATAKYAWGGSNTDLNGCDATVKRYVGYVGSGYYLVVANKSGTKVVAGTITANTLVLTYDIDGNGATENYNITIPIITINNPS